jgi:L-threonylcarbamoyladenylate synthase
MTIIIQQNNQAVDLAIKELLAQNIIAIPTDTVYGLAVDATNYEAVAKLYDIKKRQHNKPIAIFLPNLQEAKKIFSFSKLADKIAKKYLPGKLTIVLPIQNKAKLAKNLNINNNTLGFRIVDSFFISKLFAKFDRPLAVTSANLSGSTTAVSAIEIEQQFSQLAIIIDNQQNLCNQASTIVEIIKNDFKIIRQGQLIIE